MQLLTADHFAGVVATALERMAFVVVTPSHESPRDVLDACTAHAAIAVHGASAREFDLCVSATPDLVREVASGMLGIDAEDVDPAAHGCNTVAELANVLAGELVMQTTGGDLPMMIGLPQAIDGLAAVALLDVAEPTGLCVAFASDAGRLLLTARPR